MIERLAKEETGVGGGGRVREARSPEKTKHKEDLNQKIPIVSQGCSRASESRDKSEGLWGDCGMRR